MELCSLPAFYLGPNYGGGNEDNGNIPQKIPGLYCHSPCPQPCSRPPLTHAFARESRTPTGKPPVGSLFLSPGSWCTRFCCALQESISQSYVSSGSSIVGLMATSSRRTYSIPTLRAPVMWQTTTDPYLHSRYSNTGLSQSLWGPWVLVCTRFV